MNATATNAWTALNNSPEENSGTVGGDGAEEAFSLRWTKDNGDGTFGVITSYWYPVDLLERNGDGGDDEAVPTWIIENQVEYMVCTDLEDIGGSEVTCDYEYSDSVVDCVYSTLVDARAVARHKCNQEVANFERNYDWNGKD